MQRFNDIHTNLRFFTLNMLFKIVTSPKFWHWILCYLSWQPWHFPAHSTMSSIFVNSNKISWVEAQLWIVLNKNFFSPLFLFPSSFWWVLFISSRTTSPTSWWWIASLNWIQKKTIQSLLRTRRQFYLVSTCLSKREIHSLLGVWFWTQLLWNCKKRTINDVLLPSFNLVLVCSLFI